MCFASFVAGVGGVSIKGRPGPGEDLIDKVGGNILHQEALHTSISSWTEQTWRTLECSGPRRGVGSGWPRVLGRIGLLLSKQLTQRCKDPRPAIHSCNGSRIEMTQNRRCATEVAVVAGSTVQASSGLRAL